MRSDFFPYSYTPHNAPAHDLLPERAFQSQVSVPAVFLQTRKLGSLWCTPAWRRGQAYIKLVVLEADVDASRMIPINWGPGVTSSHSPWLPRLAVHWGCSYLARVHSRWVPGTPPQPPAVSSCLKPPITCHLGPRVGGEKGAAEFRSGQLIAFSPGAPLCFFSIPRCPT